MIVTNVYEWLGEASTRNRNVTQSLETYKLNMTDLESILNVWTKQIRLWKTFTTRMKIQQLLLKFMSQGSIRRPGYSRVMARFTINNRK